MHVEAGYIVYADDLVISTPCKICRVGDSSPRSAISTGTVYK